MQLAAFVLLQCSSACNAAQHLTPLVPSPVQECSVAHVIGLFRLDQDESLLRQGGCAMRTRVEA